jgi:protein involved in polysaccharide export with SLBB domain
MNIPALPLNRLHACLLTLGLLPALAAQTETAAAPRNPAPVRPGGAPAKPREADPAVRPVAGPEAGTAIPPEATAPPSLRSQPAAAPAANDPAPTLGTPKPFVLASDLFSAPLARSGKQEVRMGSDYLLGPGDHLLLNVFGGIALSTSLTIDRSGKIAIPNVAVVDVRGLTLEHARTVVRYALQRKYSRLEDFSLEVVDLHDVEVFLIGEVRRPGSYLAPSSSSPVSLLNVAGGPSENGSYRAIQHIRGGRVLQTLDLYRLRFEGKGLESRGFQDGDTLFVPLAGVRITVDGAFRRVAAANANPKAPGVLMELAAGETAKEALGFAGGLLPEASQILVTVQRTNAAGITTVTNIRTAEAELRAFSFAEGDTLRALVRAERNPDYVEAAGHVAVPGRFAFTPGMRVHDLLSLNAEGDQLLPGTYRLRGELLRTRYDGRTELLSFDVAKALKRDPAEDLELQPRDRMELSDVVDLRLPKRVTILGPLSHPGIYDWSEGMRASDLIFRAGVPKLSADRTYAELATMKDGKTSSVVRLDLSRLLSTEASAPLDLKNEQFNPRLQPYDQITVYDNPDFRMHRTVTISGQVRRPGPYVIREERFTLRQLIERAGGLTPSAMPAGGIFLRSTLQAKDLTAKDMADTGSNPDDPTSLGIANINNILKRLSETKRNKDNGALQDTPLLHGLLEGTVNRLVVDFQAILTGNGRQDVNLMDGDQVFIPRTTDSAYVVGEVASPFSNFNVGHGDKVRDLIQLAGGFTRNADKDEVRLLKADGRILDNRVQGRAVEPGDTVLVPQRIRKDLTWQESLLAFMPLAILYNTIHR